MIVTPLQHTRSPTLPPLPPSSSPVSAAETPHSSLTALSSPPLFEQSEEIAQPPAPVEDQQQRRDDVIASLVRDVAALRGLQLQRQTPSSLRFTSIATRFRHDCRVLSIVGDGRCQLYSLQQVERAMLPTAYEADELRKQLKAHLLASYTEEEWRDRVPWDLREIISLQQFAERYLSRDTTNLPHDSIALWQDVRQRQTDVFILNQSPQGKHVEKIPCRGTARDAVVLLFKWRGVGHYELVTYNNVICLPRQHAFILHLDELHGKYVGGLSKEVKRAARNSVKRTAGEREYDVDVEDEAAALSTTVSATIDDQQHLCELNRQLNEARMALEEKNAENDNFRRVNAELSEQLKQVQRDDIGRLPQPDDSPSTARELKRSAAAMHRYLSITVPPTPRGVGPIFFNAPPSLEVPPTPTDVCCICRIESADTALSPCKHRCCQMCWTREKEAWAQRNKKKEGLSRELDLPVQPLVYLCPLCRLAVKDGNAEPSEQVEPSEQAEQVDEGDGDRGTGRGRGRGRKRKR